MKKNALVRECEATAALYALGALPEESARQFQQRVASGCPMCTATLAEYTEVTDHLPLTVPQVEPPASIRVRLLERIAGPPPASKPDRTIVRSTDSPWVPLPAPGVEIRRLLGRKTLLVRMQPGAVFPEHEHRHTEQCYVLEGSIIDSDGVTTHAGDYVCLPAGMTHRPIRTETGCVFLIAYTN